MGGPWKAVTVRIVIAALLTGAVRLGFGELFPGHPLDAKETAFVFALCFGVVAGVAWVMRKLRREPETKEADDEGNAQGEA
jgi:hypothetical protein